MKSNRVTGLRGATIALAVFSALSASIVFADMYDFEDGGDGVVVQSPDPGIAFVMTGGANWIYGDWRTGEYWGPFPDGPYYSFGNFFAWLGPNQNEGRINLPFGATFFGLRYSSADSIRLVAYNNLGISVDEATGDASLDVATMGTLSVESEEMAFVKVIGPYVGFGNYWIIDNVTTVSCESDEDCDDGVFCNGKETCVDAMCIDGDTSELCPDDGMWCNGEEFCDTAADDCKHKNPPACLDDGMWCNGEEYCDELADRCEHRDEPDCGDDGLFCNGDESCDEDADECVSSGDPCEPENLECNEDEDTCDDHPIGKPGDIDKILDETFRGGGCGCA